MNPTYVHDAMNALLFLFIGVPILIVVSKILLWFWGGVGPLPKLPRQSVDQHRAPDDWRDKPLWWRNSPSNWNAKDPLSQVWQKRDDE